MNLVAALLEAQHPLTRAELGRRVGGYASQPEAFRRTFERDKDLLRQMGMPLITEPIDPDRPDDQVGYRIPRERYELADPGLDEDELAALRLAASAVAVEGAWGRDATTTALRKLAAIAGDDQRRDKTLDAGLAAPMVGGSVGMARMPGGDRVAAAFAAVAERRQVRFTYRSGSRRVDPWRLSYRKGQWYLSGLDHDRGEERLFRLDRMEGPLEGMGPPGAFDRPTASATAPPPPWRLGDGDEVMVQLAVDGPHARWIADEAGPETRREERADGSVVFVLGVTSTDGLFSLVLGLLDHAEILAPAKLRTEMIAYLSGVAGLV